jgi:AraC-like DNA-binding protein
VLKVQRLRLQAHLVHVTSTQAEQRLTLNWQNQLGAKIVKHNEQGTQWLEEDAGALTSVRLHHLLDEDEWSSDSPVISGNTSRNCNLVSPEQRPIDLPSSRGLKFCQKHPEVVKIECSLRIAQADEHLHLIRQNLIHRANLYRTTIRHTSNHRRLGASEGTCSHALAANLGRTVRLYAQQYRIGRAMWKTLGVGPEQCKMYEDLTREDLYTNTKTYDASSPESYRQKLPWFWLINVKTNMDGDEYIASCEIGHSLNNPHVC